MAEEQNAGHIHDVMNKIQVAIKWLLGVLRRPAWASTTTAAMTKSAAASLRCGSVRSLVLVTLAFGQALVLGPWFRCGPKSSIIGAYPSGSRVLHFLTAKRFFYL
jgi:hypothetical protein